MIRGSTFRWMPAVDAPASVDRVTSVPETAAELPPESAGVRAVFAQLQVALHVLVAALLALTVVGAHQDTSGGLNLPAMAAAVGFAAVYVAGTVWERRRQTSRSARLGWLAAVLALWAALVVQVPEAAYLVFPLFFLAQFLLPVWAGVAAVVALAAVAVVALGVHDGFTPAGVIGPAVGALVALGLGVGVGAGVGSGAAVTRRKSSPPSTAAQMRNIKMRVNFLAVFMALLRLLCRGESSRRRAQARSFPTKKIEMSPGPVCAPMMGPMCV